MPDARVTVPDLARMKASRRKITMLTAYDFSLAQLLDGTGIDVILVGDSLGMVVLGYETTAPVTMDEMIHHAKAVRRGVAHALLIGDMPFMSFRASVKDAVRNAGRFIQEAGCDAVKIEWKPGIEDVAKAILDAGIPVMGHVGLTPQTAATEGGFGMRGKDVESALRIIAQAVSLQEVGCFAMVLECLPAEVAKEITERLSIPTIGIGSGPSCDGQVLVTYDLLGLFTRFTPRFVKRYADLAKAVHDAVGVYRDDVRAGRFPAPEQTVSLKPEELAKLFQELGKERPASDH